MPVYRYTPKGVCSRQMDIDVENGIINSLVVYGGCSGNLAGISKLVQGQKAQDVIDRLKGTKCGPKPTSCPDQLAQALEAILEKEKNV